MAGATLNYPLMAPLPVIPTVIRVAITGVTPAGTPWANVIHYRNDTVGSDYGSITNAHQNIEKFYSSAGWGGTNYGWMRLADSDCKTLSYRYTILDGSSASVVIDDTNVGFASDSGLAPDTAAVLSWHTAVRGPQARGRTYLPGFGEGSNDINGRFDATNAASLATYATYFLNQMLAIDCPLVVASYVHGVYNDILSVNVSTTWKSQRRRR